MTWPAFLLLVITGVQRLPLLASFQPFPPALFQKSHSAQPGNDGKEKNPDLTHSRPKEQAGESQTASPLGEVAFGAGAQPG